MPAPDRHGVVLGHHTLGLHREDPVQIATAGPPKGGPLFRCRYAELRIELGDVAFSQKTVGRLDRRDPRQPQLLRQPPLPGPKAALRSAPRLGRVRRDHLNPQLLQRPSHLRQPVLIHPLPLLDGYEKMAPTIAVQRTEQPLVWIASRSAAITV